MAVGTVVFGDGIDVLGTIHEPWVQMAVWNRPSPYRPIDLANPVDVYSDGRWVASTRPCADWLLDDVRLLGELFSHLTAQPLWRAQCESVVTRTCPGFHQDADRLRLITTYAGPGTEWTFAGDVEAAREDGVDPVIRRLVPGQVIALKGRQGGAAALPGGVLHRSPAASRKKPRVFCAFRLVDAVPWMQDEELGVGSRCDPVEEPAGAV